MPELDSERLIKIEEREKSNTHRIDKLEKLYDTINEQNKNIAEMVVELRHTNEQLAAQSKRLDEIEKQPRTRMNQIVTAIISALIGSTISAAVAVIITNM